MIKNVIVFDKGRDDVGIARLNWTEAKNVIETLSLN